MRTFSVIKASLLIFQLLIASSIYAINPLLVYRNDGEFNVFDYNEIDSISFSTYDLDSIQQPSIVVQDVWTKHGVVRIPLSSIERVSNIPPATVLYPDAIEIKGDLLTQLKYVENDTILHFNSTLSENSQLRPENKLVTLNTSSKLPIGFCGKIESLTSKEGEIIVKCSRVSLTDVYESLFLYSDIEIENDDTNEARQNDMSTSSVRVNPSRISANIDSKLDISAFRKTFEIDGSLEISDLLSLGTSQEASIELVPVIHLKSAIVIEKRRLDTYVSLGVDLYCSEGLSLSYTGELSKDFSFPTLSVAAGPLFKLFLKGGLRVSLNGSIGINVGSKQHFQLYGTASYSSCKDSDLQGGSDLTFKLIDSSRDIQDYYGDFSVKIGPFLQFGVAAITPDLVNVNIDTSGGVKFDANAKVDRASLTAARSSTILYEALSSPDALQFGFYRDASLNLEILGGLPAASLSLGETYRKLWSSPVFPIFSQIKAKRNFNNLTQIDASGCFADGFIPCEAVSFRVTEKDDPNNLSFLEYNSNSSYEISGEDFELSSSFYDMGLDKGFTIYPTINIGNYVIMAKPNVDVNKDECRIDNVRQIEHEFTSDNKAIVNVEVETNSDSDNWHLIGFIGSFDESQDLGQVQEGQNVQQLKINVDLKNIPLDNHWPYEYSLESNFLPVSKGNPSIDQPIYQKTLKLDYTPENYYLIGSFQGWNLDKDYLEFKSLGENKYSVKVNAPMIDNHYDMVLCKVMPVINGCLSWDYQIGGEAGLLNDGDSDIILNDGASAYTIEIDMNNFSYTYTAH